MMTILEKRKMKKKYIWCLVLLAVILLVIFTSYLYYRNDVVLDVSQRQDGNIDFHFDYINANGLLNMRVWEKDSRMLLWNIRLNFKGNILKYGEVPIDIDSPANSARQIYPENGQPPKLIELGKEYYVDICYRHDDFMSACASDVFYVFRIGPDGFVKKVNPESIERWQNP